MNKYLSLLFTLSWMGVIFYFSHQPGDESGALSGGVLESLEAVLSINLEPYHTFIRKSAHFIVYFILGVFVVHTLFDFNVKPRQGIIIAILFCLLYAISDEMHQTFIANRSGELRDVIIDTIGASVGIYIMTLINYYKSNTY